MTTFLQKTVLVKHNKYNYLRAGHNYSKLIYGAKGQYGNFANSTYFFHLIIYILVKVTLAKTMINNSEHASEYFLHCNPASLNDKAEIRKIETYVPGYFVEPK